MIGKDSARTHLEKRIAEYELGVKNGGDMAPDVLALSVMVLEMDRKLDTVLERLDRGCCWWMKSALAAVGENKAAVGVIVAAVTAFAIAFADTIMKSFK